MKRIVNNIITLEIKDLIDFDFPYNELFGLEVIDNNIKYEFLIRFSNYNKRLLCFGSGAVARKGSKAINPPIFNRYSWNEEFNESILFYNDPTLYLSDNLRLGWGVGTTDDYYLETIAKIIDIISKNLEIKQKNILFYGSSGGGFTSIQLATLIKKSTALVNNSQFILRNFNLSGHYDDMIKTCFKKIDGEYLNKYEYRLNVLEMFKKEEYIPPIIYYVNAGSQRDINKQCIPFINGISELSFFDDNIQIFLYNSENEHDPLNKKDSIKLIKMVSHQDVPNHKNKTSQDIQIKNMKKENQSLKKSLNKYKSRKIVKFTNKLLKIKKRFLNIKL